MEAGVGPVFPLEGSPDLPPRENLSAVQGARNNQGQDSQEPKTASPLKENQTTPTNSTETEMQVVKPKKTGNKSENKLILKKPLNSMWNFPFEAIFRRWYREEPNVFRITIEDLGLKSDQVDLEQLVQLLNIAADIRNSPPQNKNEFYEILTREYDRYFISTPIDQRPTIEKFDNYLYHWAKKVWPRALDIIFEECRLRNRAAIAEAFRS